MKNNYYYEVYDLDKKTGRRAGLIARGYTEDLPAGDIITARTKKEQRAAIETAHGYGKSIYMKLVEGYGTSPADV